MYEKNSYPNLKLDYGSPSDFESSVGIKFNAKTVSRLRTGEEVRATFRKQTTRKRVETDKNDRKSRMCRMSGLHKVL